MTDLRAAWSSKRATGLVNAVLRRLANEHERIELPALENDPLGHLMHALSLPMWVAGRFIEADTWPGFVAKAALVALPAPFVGLFVVLNRAERAKVLGRLGFKGAAAA